MPSLDQLQMFINAADSGSFSAAARRLGKGQSAVSLGIANLEIDLGVELFDRATRKPQLTREGERLLGFARAVVQQALDLEIAASALMQGAETRIRLAVDDANLVAEPGQETERVWPKISSHSDRTRVGGQSGNPGPDFVR